MQVYQRKKRFSDYLYSPVTLVILLILLVFFGRATWRIFAKERESARNLTEANTELQNLQEKQKTLDESIARLSTPEGVEEELRSKYAITKPGEDLVVIVDDDKPAEVEEKPKEKSWWDHVLDFFGL